VWICSKDKGAFGPMATLDEVKKALGDPVIDDLPDLARKLRRNLLVSSSLALIYVWGRIKLERTAPLGVEITELSEPVISISLLLIVLYNLIHFVWHCFDYIGIWRIHLTGTRLAFLTGSKWASEHADYPEDPRQSNLYRWWQEKAAGIGNLSQIARTLEETASQLSCAAKKYEPSAGELSVHFFSDSASTLVEKASELSRKLDAINKLLLSNQPPVSIERFDRWFANFKTSHLIRLFVVELGVPCVLAIAALASITIRLFMGSAVL
jgi:hypothetical protein